MSVKDFAGESKVEQAKALAAKYMREGWGSRSSLFHAIYDLFETGLSFDTFLRICSIIDPFHAPAAAIYKNGQGTGVTVCGALSSALAAFGMVHGEKNLPYHFWTDGLKKDGWLTKILDDPTLSEEEKLRVFNEKLTEIKSYRAYREIVARFHARFGTTECLELQKPYGTSVSRECFRNCARIVAWTAGMVTEVILAYEKDPCSFKTEGEGENVYAAVLHTANCP